MDWAGAAAEAHAGENKNDDGNKNHMFHLSQTGDVLLSPVLVPSLFIILCISLCIEHLRTIAVPGSDPVLS